MDFKKRLSEAMDVRKCTRAALAKALEVSVQAIGLVLSGDTRAMTAENAAKAARFLRIDYYWLATGEGSMEPSQSWPVQRVPVERFTSLTPPEQAYVEGRLEEAIRACENRSDQAATDELHKPVRKAKRTQPHRKQA